MCRVRRGGLPHRVAARLRGRSRLSRADRRPGAGRRRGRRAAPVARSGGAHAPELARAGRRALLRDVLLRLRHPVLPGQASRRSRRPAPDTGRARPLRLLARLGASPPTPAARPRRRRPGRAPAARGHAPHRLHRLAPSTRRGGGLAAPAPLGSERLAQRSGQPRAAASCSGARARGARPPPVTRPASLFSRAADQSEISVADFNRPGKRQGDCLRGSAAGRPRGRLRRLVQRA